MTDPAPGPVARAVSLIGWPSLAIGAGHVVALALAWRLFVGEAPDADPPLAGVVFGLWPALGLIAGLVDGLPLFYGGPAPSVRGRLVLGGLRFDGSGLRLLVLLVAVVVGNLAGRLLVAPEAVEAGLDLAPWTAPVIGVLFGIIGYLTGFLVLLMVVVPVGFVVASFLPPVEGEQPANVFGVMSVGELRGGSLAVLAVAWLIPGLTLATTGLVEDDAARLWLISCAVAIVLIVVGVVVNNLAVKKRNRAGVVTAFDEGLRGLRRRGR